MAASSPAPRRRAHRRPTPRLIYGLYTDQGSRPRNEDAAACYALADDELLAIVADGMGGGLDGKRFSDSAVDRVQATFISSVSPDGGARLDEAARAAVAALSELRQSDPRYGGSGSTLVAAQVLARPGGAEARFLNIGDSPLFHVHAATRGAEQLSTDHTYAEALIRAGIPRADAMRHPQGEQLTHVLGATLDMAAVPGYNPQRLVIMRPGDRLVLCSDGVSKHITMRELAELALAGAPDEAARQLAQRALRNGSRDNVTALVIQCQHERRGLSPVVLAILALMLIVGLGAAGVVAAQNFIVAPPPPPATPLATVTPLPTGTAGPTVAPTATDPATATPAPSVEPSATPTPTATATPTITPSPRPTTPAPTTTPEQTITPEQSATPEQTTTPVTPTPEPTIAPGVTKIPPVVFDTPRP